MATLPIPAVLVNTARRFGVSRRLIVDYSSLLSGQVGRLVFSLLYFIVLTRTLSLGDYGIFATASAIGVVLSRLTGLGFISPLYRVATTRPRLIGAYTAGFMLAFAVSLVPIIAIAFILHAALYDGLIALTAFACVIAAEAIFWRLSEMVIIVNNGLNRFLTGSLLAIGGVAARAAIAFAFWLAGKTSLADWTLAYLVTNVLVALIAIAFFYPRQKLRWRPRAWSGRARDALGVSAAEALFYIQSELDKVLVLALGGEIVAGIYSIIMRLADLTAMPLRAMSTMLTQWIMRARQAGRDLDHGLIVDFAIGALSAIALLAVFVLLSIVPGIVGENITRAAELLPFLLLVPAFRNVVEYHTDLLYAYELMGVRVSLLLGLVVLKAALLSLLLGYSANFTADIAWLNGVFAALFVLSALVTYGRLAKANSR